MRVEELSYRPTIQENLSLKTRKFLARAGLAAVCVMPAADFALSDASSVYARQKINHSPTIEALPGKDLVERGLLGSIIITECFLLALPVTRMKKLQGISEAFEEHLQKKRSRMKLPRRIVSKTINAPLTAIGWVGEKAENFGNKIVSSTDSRSLRAMGKLAVDFGQVNAMGTTAVAMQEATRHNRPVTKARIAGLSGIITASWLGSAEVFQRIYDAADHLSVPGQIIRGGFRGIGEGLNMATDIQSPSGIATMGGIATCLAISGWNIARFHEEKNLTSDSEVLSTDFELADATIVVPPNK